MRERPIWGEKFWGFSRRSVGVRRIISSPGRSISVFPGCVMLIVPRLADVVSAEGVLDTLVDPRQPSWFLYGALRALALFTSSEFQCSPTPRFLYL